MLFLQNAFRVDLCKSKSSVLGFRVGLLDRSTLFIGELKNDSFGFLVFFTGDILPNGMLLSGELSVMHVPEVSCLTSSPFNFVCEFLIFGNNINGLSQFVGINLKRGISLLDAASDFGMLELLLTRLIFFDLMIMMESLYFSFFNEAGLLSISVEGINLSLFVFKLSILEMLSTVSFKLKSLDLNRGCFSATVAVALTSSSLISRPFIKCLTLMNYTLRLRGTSSNLSLSKSAVSSRVDLRISLDVSPVNGRFPAKFNMLLLVSRYAMTPRLKISHLARS